MKAPDESSIMKDFPENATEWIASCGKRCTDGQDSSLSLPVLGQGS